MCLPNFDDDGYLNLWWHMPIGPNKVKTKCNLYEGECFIVVKVASSFKCYFYGSPFPLVMYHSTFEFFYEIQLTHRKVSQMSVYFIEI